MLIATLAQMRRSRRDGQKWLLQVGRFRGREYTSLAGLRLADLNSAFINDHTECTADTIAFGHALMAAFGGGIWMRSLR